MYTTPCATRRQFLRASLLGGAAAAMGSLRFGQPARAAEAATGIAPAAAAVPVSRVALTTGDGRADMAFRGLKFFEKEIAAAIGNRRVIVKPNNVSIDVQLAATHADNLEGIFEFLKSIGKIENAVLAESAAPGATLTGFENLRYNRVAEKYGVKMMDLDQQPVKIVQVFDERDFRPHPARMSSILLDENSFIISAARMKTHDRVVATLSLKNIIVGAAIKDMGFAWGRGAKPGAKSDKATIHGGGFRGINYNLFAIAQHLHPHLAVIDGFDGMEGNGPVGGRPVDHRVCVVSSDWLAADRVGIELMGIDFAKVGYLNFCANAGLGQGDLAKIEVLGEPVGKHIKKYAMNANFEQQLIWMKPAPRA